MNRRRFLGLSGLTVTTAIGAGYLFSDRSNVGRKDIPAETDGSMPFQPFEREILSLASLAPSGHNTQPWLVRYIEPYHWVIMNDKSRWLPAVDPGQRETILSIGAFIQNLEYAAGNFGFACQSTFLATRNQDEDIMDIKLLQETRSIRKEAEKIRSRRTVRSNYRKDRFKPDDIKHLVLGEQDFIHFVDKTTKPYQWLNNATLEANIIQAYRNDAQMELAEWIRFSSVNARTHRDGLTTASMELTGIPAWVLRNFYDKEEVMTKKFREQGIQKIREQVGASAGWLVLTSKDAQTQTLLETGMRMQRLFLKIRERSIAMHPMTQVLEETKTQAVVNQALGITEPVQFLLRTGYVPQYPDPVSLRRPIEWFVRLP